MLKAIVAAAAFGTGAMFMGLAPAAADEVVIHRDVDRPAPQTSSTTVVKHGGEDCTSRTVHRSDGAGDSSTTRQTNCD